MSLNLVIELYKFDWPSESTLINKQIIRISLIQTKTKPKSTQTKLKP